MKPPHPYHSELRIGTIDHLSSLVGRSPSDLIRIAESAGRYYAPFDVRRRANVGKWRHIDNPNEELKQIQRGLQRHLLQRVPLPEGLHGGIAGHSTLTNAAPHVRQPCIATIDLRNCFPKTSAASIHSALRRHIHLAPDVVHLVTKLTSFQHRLPQGAPTSSMLANLTLIPLCLDLHQLAVDYRLAMTLFVDDLTLSGTLAREAMTPAIRLIQRHGHAVRNEKIHVMDKGEREEVTGHPVNRKVSLGQNEAKDIRLAILDLANRTIIPVPELETIWGRVSHAKSVAPHLGLALERLANRLLPSFIRSKKKIRRAQTRPCYSTAKHAFD